MVDLSKYFPADTDSRSISKAKSPRRSKLQKSTNTGLDRINKSALNKASSLAVRKITTARVAKENEIYQDKLKREAVAKKKRHQIKQARIRKQRHLSIQFNANEDRQRQKALYGNGNKRTNKPPGMVAPASRLLNRILNTPPIESNDNYTYSHDRMQSAIVGLSSVLENIQQSKD